MQARFFAGDYEAAIEAAQMARRRYTASTSLITTPFFGLAEYHFIARLPAQHAAIPQASANGSSIWRP